MIGHVEKQLDNGLIVYNLTICGFKYGRDLYSMYQVGAEILKVGNVQHINDFMSDEEFREAVEIQRSETERSQT